MKIPVVANKITYRDIFAGLQGLLQSKKNIQHFEKALAEYIGKRYCYAVGSGKTGFYILLKSLSDITGKKEIIMPAYTDAGLVAVIKKAGLEVVLCDISLDNFNIDSEKVSSYITDNTLCILAVHMFGIPCNIEKIMQIGRKYKIPVIEDCAQAMGSKVGGKSVGSFGDASFFSFGRGKNMPTYTGGAILTDNTELAEKIQTYISKLKHSGYMSNFTKMGKILALAFAVKPLFYTLLYPFISKYKSFEIPEKFPFEKYGTVQAKVALSLIKRIEENSSIRNKNGNKMINKMKDNNKLMLPKLPDNMFPAYNRMPILVKQWGIREEIRKKLTNTGIETSFMYERPIHKIYDLNYNIDKNVFPNATYFAEHLLTVPVHYIVNDKIMNIICDSFKY